eukprot:m.157528 g.157528  ORF g.157528 m.157528 type:complete len:80 (+) comp10231_c1_seq5:129-368(+)
MASAEERGTVRRLLHLKEQLDLALDKSDMAVAADILSELTQIAMNIELMRATRITTSLGALRKVDLLALLTLDSGCQKL